jgi:hypothetical protein
LFPVIHSRIKLRGDSVLRQHTPFRSAERGTTCQSQRGQSSKNSQYSHASVYLFQGQEQGSADWAARARIKGKFAFLRELSACQDSFRLSLLGMIRNFSISAHPTGFNDSEVVLTGIIEWSFDEKKEKLLSVAARNLQLSRDQFLSNTGVLYRFSSDVMDLSERRVLETNVGGSRGLRDTAHLLVRLMAKHNDGHGMVNTILTTEELWDAGNRYFEPPLP